MSVDMLWEGKELRDIEEDDVRRVVNSGLAEHLQLEYKSELYSNNNHGNKESLLDLCMFANAEGGVLLIGVPELRDAEGQPTGLPNPEAPLGLEIPNPEAALQAIDARVTAAIEERLRLESAAIRFQNGSYVLALRVENSTAKPHCVRYQGHVYFPSRRQRSRYEMDVREIKELVMQTTSQQEKARALIEGAFLNPIVANDQLPYLYISTVPVFYRDFLLSLNSANARLAVTNFDALNEHPQPGEISYVFAGLERRGQFDSSLQLRRNGLIYFKRQLPTRDEAGLASFYPTAIDLQLRHFVLRSKDLFRSCEISGPYLLSMTLRTPSPLAGRYAGAIPWIDEITAPIAPGRYDFPAMQIDDFVRVDRLIQPFCDHAHQAFGRRASPCFNLDGDWVGIG